MKKTDIPQKYKSIISIITKAAAAGDYEVYAVGGFVRDLFTGRQPNDLDIMVESVSKNSREKFAGIDFSELVARTNGLHEPVIFERFGTSKLIIENEEVEFVMPRKEYYEDNSRNPDTEIGSLSQDALRRDFTVNALFLRLGDMEILDLTGRGIADIENKIIRVTDPAAAEIIFNQDPLRILRAVRQSLQLGFTIEKDTYEAMKKASGRICIVSPERIRDEINKIIAEDKPSEAFRMMDDIGLLEKIFPELHRLKGVPQPEKYHDDDVFEHTLKVLDRSANEPAIRIAALLHDSGKADVFKNENGRISFHGHEEKSALIAENTLKRLKYSKEFTADAVNIIKNHMYPKMYDVSWKDAAVRRFAGKCAGALESVIKFSKADYGKDKPDEKIYDLEKRICLLKEKNELYPKAELLNGQEIMEISGLPAGSWIKEAKEKIYEAQIEDPRLTKEEAVEIVKVMLSHKK